MTDPLNARAAGAAPGADRPPEILSQIVERRRGRLRVEGYALGCHVPRIRVAPLVPFGGDPFLITEIKRRSPSKGWIARDLSAASHAALYRREGSINISVLTEEDHFAGSLDDLMAVKMTVPDAAVLRKDFLLDEEDVEVSYRAGADAVLLIARILSAAELEKLYAKARRLGMEALVEVYDEEDVRKAARVRPSLTGINSRNLARFTTDLVHPLMTANMIDWPTRLVFESGIRCSEEAAYALSSGFSGILAGEAVVRDGRLIGELLGAFKEHEEAAGRGARAGGGTSAGDVPHPGPRDFWKRLYAGKRAGRPLVKICGLTNEEDARRAASLGADILGFILAPSPRKADPAILERLTDISALKVAVALGGVPDGGAGAAAELLARGLIDCVQLHGDENPAECFSLAFPYYKVVRVSGAEDVERIASYRCPRVLVDAFSPHARGGTGKTIPGKTVHMIKDRFPLWLAGGIGPENVRRVVEEFSPELIDALSRLESAPGKKDPELMERFFKELEGGATA